LRRTPIPKGSYKGFYTPTNPHKYRGDPKNCVYRSLWERRFMVFCDTNPNITEWSSEEVIIPYRSPFDKKIHRYFVDFWIKTKNKDGLEENTLIEIKPKKKTVQPSMPSGAGARVSRGKMTEVRDWMVNSAKWEAAREFCADRKWKFQILTEDDIFGAKK